MGGRHSSFAGAAAGWRRMRVQIATPQRPMRGTMLSPTLCCYVQQSTGHLRSCTARQCTRLSASAHEERWQADGKSREGRTLRLVVGTVALPQRWHRGGRPVRCSSWHCSSQGRHCYSCEAVSPRRSREGLAPPSRPHSIGPHFAGQTPWAKMAQGFVPNADRHLGAKGSHCRASLGCTNYLDSQPATKGGSGRG